MKPPSLHQVKCANLHSRAQLGSVDLASFHGDPADCPASHPIFNPNVLLCATSSSFHSDYIQRNSHTLNPNQNFIPAFLHGQPVCEFLPPASFRSDHNAAGGSTNPNFCCASRGHLSRGLCEALPASVLGEFRGASRQAMPVSFHGDNGASAGGEHDVLHGLKARKPEIFHGEQMGSAGLVNPNHVWETEGRQIPASFHGELEAALSWDRRRPLPASKSIKAASVRNASRAEILHRKKISQLFSKLEVLLPPEAVLKHDRCSIMDATIQYITSLEERIARELRKRETCSNGMIENESMVGRRKKEDSCMNIQVNEGPKHCGSPKQLEEYWKKEELGASMISIRIRGNENVFINVVTHHLDPLLFTSLFTVLHHHHLQISTASLTQTDKVVYFSFSTKISLSKHEYNKKSLEDAISEALKQA